MASQRGERVREAVLARLGLHFPELIPGSDGCAAAPPLHLEGRARHAMHAARASTLEAGRRPALLRPESRSNLQPVRARHSQGELYI